MAASLFRHKISLSGMWYADFLRPLHIFPVTPLAFAEV